MRILLLLSLSLLLLQAASAQRYFSRNAGIRFTSETPVEKIEALNNSGTVSLDTKTGKMEWKVLIKGFLFEKALMQEHFNENYLESTTFPSATFTGDITNLSAINFGASGKYKVTVHGVLTLHGVSKEIDAAGVIKVNGGKIEMLSNFSVNPEDYQINIPAMAREKIAKEIKVTVSAVLE